MPHQTTPSAPKIELPPIGKGLQAISDTFFDALQSIGPFLSLIPGIGPTIADILKSPIGISGQRSREGAELSEQLLESLRTNPLGRISPTGTVVPGSGGLPGVSLPNIGAQAVSERKAGFEALQELAAEQRGSLMGFRQSLGNTFQGLEAAEAAIVAAGQSNNQIFRGGLAAASRLRRDTLAFVGAGLRGAAAMIGAIRTDNRQVLERIDLEVAERTDTLVSGVRARTNAQLTETMRALDSVSPLAPEERVALTSLFERQAATDTATAVGQLHAGVSEFRSRVDADLTNTLTQARSQANVVGGQLVATGITSFQEATRFTTDLRASFMQQNQALAATRATLRQFMGQFSLDAANADFRMVTEMVRPVFVMSDIMADLWDMAFDVQVFNNGVAQQDFMNDLVALSPKYEAALAAFTGLEAAREAKNQRELTRSEGSRNRTTQIGAAVAQGAVTGLTSPSAPGAPGAAPSAPAPRVPAPPR